MITGCTGGVCCVYEQNQRCSTEDFAAEHEVARVWLFMLLLYSGLLHVARRLPQ